MVERLRGLTQSLRNGGPSDTASLRYADVVVSVPTTNRDDAFTYSIPVGMELRPGHLVQVPFGQRRVHGVVVRLTGRLRVDYTKAIHAIVYPQPLLTPSQLELAHWVSDYYMAPLFQAVAPMLPPGFRTPNQATIRLVDGVTPSEDLSPSARRLLAYLKGRSGPVRLPALTRRLGTWVANAAHALATAGLVQLGWSEPGPRGTGRRWQSLRLAAEPETALHWAEAHERRAPRQAALARRLADPSAGPYLAAAARHEHGASAVATMVANGLAKVEAEFRPPGALGANAPPRAEAPLLPTPAQAAALEEVRAALDSPAINSRVFLLQGVTGSGKTEVYLQSLAHCLAEGKRGIVLVPELSLTPQMVARFEARFPGQVGVLHSGLTPAQQVDQWWRVRDGRYPIVVGSRGAVFAPQQPLGLIVVDEEHEWTYKQQDASPRYHSREVATRLADLTGAVVLLGSATPDMTSAYRAGDRRYRLLTLPERIEPPGMPSTVALSRMAQVEVVDMREELRAGNRGVFSATLRSALEECVGSGHQAILFLNRRGSAGVVQCRRCGFVVRCWRCNSPYTSHGDEGLVCHHCNRRRAAPTTCPQCRGPHIRYLGLGTQRVVEEVERLLPDSRVLRWDRDTASTGRAHQALLEQFASGQANVLVGTQMIAKGLHVPTVTLVGAVLADIGLHVPDYRAAERTFQVLCQVAGRAGRGIAPGRVIVQTFLPDHYAIQTAAAQEYEAFYQRELSFRRAHRYPPLGQLIRLFFGHTDEAASRQEAHRMAATLKRLAREWGINRVDVIGPAPAYPARLRGVWRWHLLLRGNNPRLLLDKVTLPPNWVVDVDPVSTA